MRDCCSYFRLNIYNNTNSKVYITEDNYASIISFVWNFFFFFFVKCQGYVQSSIKVVEGTRPSTFSGPLRNKITNRPPPLRGNIRRFIIRWLKSYQNITWFWEKNSNIKICFLNNFIKFWHPSAVGPRPWPSWPVR